jgi:GT2 family glycosyltransferase
MAKVFIGIVTYAQDEHCLQALLEHLAAQEFQDWSLHFIDTTVASGFSTQTYAPRLEAAMERFLPGKAFTIAEHTIHRAEGEGKFVLIARAREELRQQFLASDAECCFFLDDDVLLPAKALSQLLQTMIAHNAQLVSGVYLNMLRHKTAGAGKMKLGPLAWIKDRDAPDYLTRPLLIIDILPSRIIPIVYAGFGCLLLRRSCLEQVSIQMAPEVQGTEDIPFFREVDRLGIQLLLDTRVKCAHRRYPLGDPRNAALDLANYTIQVRKKERGDAS